MSSNLMIQIFKKNMDFGDKRGLVSGFKRPCYVYCEIAFVVDLAPHKVDQKLQYIRIF